MTTEQHIWLAHFLFSLEGSKSDGWLAVGKGLTSPSADRVTDVGCSSREKLSHTLITDEPILGELGAGRDEIAIHHRELHTQHLMA